MAAGPRLVRPSELESEALIHPWLRSLGQICIDNLFTSVLIVIVQYCNGMSLKIIISTGSTTPIYRQIADQVRLGVANGKLAVEDQLPSVRALAEDLVLNPNTVARAYADLGREGLIESRAGRGVFVIRKRKVFTREEGRRRLEPLLDGLVGEAMAMDFTRDELREALERKMGQWKEQKEEVKR